jgi:glutamate racemase
LQEYNSCNSGKNDSCNSGHNGWFDQRLPNKESPIGLFDSGVGGLSVLRAVRRESPHEDLIYFADQKFCPYGPRPPAEIRALSRLVVKFLLAQDCKAIVVACNTASAAALDDLRRGFPEIPFVGMEPAIKPAALNSHTRKIGVLATAGTLQGELFQRTRAEHAGGVDVIVQYPADWVERVERGEVDSPETEVSVRRVVGPLLEAGVDEIALGCTHYPFLAPVIEKIVGTRVAIVDPSDAVARQTVRVLRERGLLNPEERPGRQVFYTSGDAEAFARVFEKLLGEAGDVRAIQGPF